MAHGQPNARQASDPNRESFVRGMIESLAGDKRNQHALQAYQDELARIERGNSQFKGANWHAEPGTRAGQVRSAVENAIPLEALEDKTYGYPGGSLTVTVMGGRVQLGIKHEGRREEILFLNTQDGNDLAACLSVIAQSGQLDSEFGNRMTAIYKEIDAEAGNNRSIWHSPEHQLSASLMSYLRGRMNRGKGERKVW